MVGSSVVIIGDRVRSSWASAVIRGDSQLFTYISNDQDDRSVH